MFRTIREDYQQQKIMPHLITLAQSLSIIIDSYLKLMYLLDDILQRKMIVGIQLRKFLFY
jgi:hypothetical protein